MAVFQALLNAALVPLTYAFGRRIAPGMTALAASAAVAAYPSFAYFGALTLSDLPATTILMLALVLAAWTRERPSLAFALAAGAALGLAAITRSILTPLVLPLAAFLATRRDRRVPLVAALVLGMALMTVPFVARTYAQFGALPTSSGEGLWYGYFQGRALLPDPVPAVCAAVAAGAPLPELPAISGLDAFETEMAHRGQCRRAADLPRLYADPPGAAWVSLERALFADALRLIAHDPAGWAARAATLHTVALWARDEPLPLRIVRALPTEARLALVGLELVLLVLASIGLVSAGRAGRPAAVLALVVVGYVWLASVSLWTEGRYALPVRPLFLIGVVLGLRALVGRLRAAPSTATTTPAA